MIDEAEKPKASRKLSRKVPLDSEAMHNLTGFFSLLYEIDKRNKASDSDKE